MITGTRQGAPLAATAKSATSGIATAAASHRQKYSVASAVEHRQNCMCCDQRALIPISRELLKKRPNSESGRLIARCQRRKTPGR